MTDLPLTTIIRDFIVAHFDDEELKHLSFDYFPDAYHEFTTGMRKSQMVQILLESCRRQKRLPALLAALERERPRQYAVYFAEEVQSAAASPQPIEPAVPNSKQVFISYAHQDATFAQKLATDLRQNGRSVWIAPGSIRPGEKWLEAISRGLVESGVFVLVLTDTAVASPWVRDETNVAIELSKEGKLRFIPLEVESCDIPPLWRVYQRIPFQASYEAGLRALLAELDPDHVAPLPDPSPRRLEPRLIQAIRNPLVKSVGVSIGVLGLIAVTLWLWLQADETSLPKEALANTETVETAIAVDNPSPVTMAPTPATYFSPTIRNTSTITNSSTIVAPIADMFESNDTLEEAFEIELGWLYENLNFVPKVSGQYDIDFYRWWATPGTLYVCETRNLAAITDTTVAILDSEGNYVENDDESVGDTSSRVAYFAAFPGYLHLIIRPAGGAGYLESARYTYDLVCDIIQTTPTGTTSTPTPTA